MNTGELNWQLAMRWAISSSRFIRLNLRHDTFSSNSNVMSSTLTFPEPSRRQASPRPDCDGNLKGVAVLSPESCKARAAVPVPPNKVLPVIVVPGIMGSNLRATKDAAKIRNEDIKAGEEAWRPPNGMQAGLMEAKKWKSRSPVVRQHILDPDILEVDDRGAMNVAANITLDDVRQRRSDGWGEIHADSYGPLLNALNDRLNKVFRKEWSSYGLSTQWQVLNSYDRSRWGATSGSVTERLTDEELKKIAQYHYPIYAFGYNWLHSNEKSAARLQNRIDEIIKYWQSAKQDCQQVILVTHSMGGLVARACAKKIPNRIAGIVHGVMPALGAPVCYRRIACGTESSSPSAWPIDKLTMEKVSEIMGQTPETTTPVMATAPGPLELLPNHLYPIPWLSIQVTRRDGSTKETELISRHEPYEFYRDMKSWYRMIDPVLADPANKFQGNVIHNIRKAIDQAERFHKEILGDFYHLPTYAFYGADKDNLSFITCRWEAELTTNAPIEDLLKNAVLVGRAAEGSRTVELSNGTRMVFKPSGQDGLGDGTVPYHSGAGPTGKVAGIFRTVGYDHQGSYADESMLMLTQHLIAKIIKGAK